MAQKRDTRTIHTILIDVQDDIIGGIEVGDEVEIVLVSRDGMTRPIKLSSGNIQRLVNPYAPLRR